MNRSYSKLRHIQESNILLEKRLLKESKSENEINEQPVSLLKKLFNAGKTTSKELGVVLKDTKSMSSELSQILTKIPETIKMPLKSLEPLKGRMRFIEGNVDRLSRSGSGIKSTHLGLFTSIENVTKELKTVAGSQFNLKKVINELSRAKSELERLKTITKNTAEIQQIDRSLMDVNWSLGNIEDVLKAALNK